MTKTLGVTGGIGSGKSVACRMFEDLGARVFHADDEAKRLMREDAGVRADLVEAFGPESYLPTGELNREYLAHVVFRDRKKLRQISHIVHPRVFASFDDARRRAEEDGVELFVKEAAILFESGGDSHVDAVAVVDAPVQDRIHRVMQRDGVDADAVRQRMTNQWPTDRLRRRADFVIENTGSLEHLREQVGRIYHAMTSAERPAERQKSD